MSQSYEELNKYSDADLGLFIRNYDEAVSEREGFIRRINILRWINRNQLEEEELKNLDEMFSVISQEINETYKPERDLAVRILQERSELKSTPSWIASSALASAVLASIASKGKSPAVEPQQETSALFEHPKYTQVQPEVEPQQEKASKDVASSSWEYRRNSAGIDWSAVRQLSGRGRYCSPGRPVWTSVKWNVFALGNRGNQVLRICRLFTDLLWWHD